ncbi:MAG: cupin domain-containing protein [Nocardioidaceae bacterium]
MTAIALEDESTELLASARSARSGRAAQLVIGGPETTMTQTIIALRDGATLSEHHNPGEASVLVLDGHVRLITGGEHIDGTRGDLVPVPPEDHSLEARSDAVVLLTAVKLH